MVGLGILDSFVIGYLKAKTLNLKIGECFEYESRLYGWDSPVWG
jgi:hypothetical protein